MEKEKKEIGMEKLIELLNEYGKEKGNPFDEWGFNSNEELFCKGLSSWYSEILIISKKFGFIKRLVENDKIDFNKVSKKEIESRLSIVMGGVSIETNWVLMLLSISSSPIEDLLLYLK